MEPGSADWAKGVEVVWMVGFAEAEFSWECGECTFVRSGGSMALAVGLARRAIRGRIWKSRASLQIAVQIY